MYLICVHHRAPTHYIMRDATTCCVRYYMIFFPFFRRIRIICVSQGLLVCRTD